jgi:hypothetical protein
MTETYILQWMVPGTAKSITITAWDNGPGPDTAPGPWPWQVEIRSGGSLLGSWPTHARSWVEAMSDVAEFAVRINAQWDLLIAPLKALIEPLAQPR